MRDTNDGASLEAREIDLVLDHAQASQSKGGQLEPDTALPRDEVLRAMEGMAMRFAEEAQRQMAAEQAMRNRRRMDLMSTPSVTTPSTPSVRAARRAAGSLAGPTRRTPPRPPPECGCLWRLWRCVR